MRYQKLESQEANWKWKYLLKKHREGENITKYTESSMIELKIQLLTTLQNSPDEIEKWVKTEMTAEQRKKCASLFVLAVNVFSMPKNHNQKEID